MWDQHFAPCSCNSLIWYREPEERLFWNIKSWPQKLWCGGFDWYPNLLLLQFMWALGCSYDREYSLGFNKWGYCYEYADYFSPWCLHQSAYLPFFLSSPFHLCLSFSLIFSFLALFFTTYLSVNSLPFCSFLPSLLFDERLCSGFPTTHSAPPPCGSLSVCWALQTVHQHSCAEEQGQSRVMD